MVGCGFQGLKDLGLDLGFWGMTLSPKPYCDFGPGLWE